MLIALLAAAAAQPADFAVDEATPLLEFRYRWPAAADATAPLRARLAGAMAAARARASGYARTDQAASAQEGRPFEAHWYDAAWRIDGSGPVLLSLSAEISTFTGGVHGNTDFEAILWDRATGRRVEAARLIGGNAIRAMALRFCAALDAMRAERRGNEAFAAMPDDPFTACPPLTGQVMAPADDDGNGRFETLHVLLPPYAAGPFAEGDYRVELPFEPADLAGMANRYRPDFEVAGERRPPARR